MRHLPLRIASTVLLLGALAARAEEPKNVSPPTLDPPARMQHDAASSNRKFDLLDTNHDGMLSKDEAAKDASIDSAFAKIDRNSDGVISREEFGER